MPGVISHRGAALPPFNDAQKYRFLPWGVLPRGFKIYICMSNARVQWVHVTDPHFDVMRVPGVGAQQHTPHKWPRRERSRDRRVEPPSVEGSQIRVSYVNPPNVSLPNPGRLREPAAASGRGDFATFATIMRRQSTMTLRFAQPLTPHTSFDATR